MALGGGKGHKKMTSDDVNAVQSARDLAMFVEGLARDLEENGPEWENTDLPRFLDAMAAWLRDSDGYFRNWGEPVPDAAAWRTVANVLLAARDYE
jgi:hypothetical protein